MAGETKRSVRRPSAEIAEERAERDRRRAASEERRKLRAAEADRVRARAAAEPKPKMVHRIEPRPGESAAMYQSRVDQLREADYRARVLNRWDHKNEGTPETHEYASKTRQGALSRLYLAGHISGDQLGWACEIASVAEMIERDVDVRVQSYEMRVDCSGSGRDSLIEVIVRVRREVAYGWWRERLPSPKRAILDMLVGETASYSTTALRYGMGKERARKLLISAIDLWPEAMRYAEAEVDDATLAAAHAGLMGG